MVQNQPASPNYALPKAAEVGKTWADRPKYVQRWSEPPVRRDVRRLIDSISFVHRLLWRSRRLVLIAALAIWGLRVEVWYVHRSRFVALLVVSGVGVSSWISLQQRQGGVARGRASRGSSVAFLGLVGWI